MRMTKHNHSSHRRASESEYSIITAFEVKDQGIVSRFHCIGVLFQDRSPQLGWCLRDELRNFEDFSDPRGYGMSHAFARDRHLVLSKVWRGIC